MSLWYEKPEFVKWNKKVQELVNKINEKLGGEYKVEQQPLKGTPWKWKLYRHNIFAYSRSRKKANVLRTSTKKEWATSAGVANLAGAHHKDNCWWPHYPCTFWDLDIDNDERLEEIAGILAKACRARHR